MITFYENYEKVLRLIKTLLIQRTTFGVILLVHMAFELSGRPGDREYGSLVVSLKYVHDVYLAKPIYENRLSEIN